MTAFRYRSCAAALDSELLGEATHRVGQRHSDDYWDEDGSTRTRRADLSTRAHMHDLVIAFYREIMFDELLEPILGEVAEVDWVEHIPRLIDYWCSILFSDRAASQAR